MNENKTLLATIVICAVVSMVLRLLPLKVTLVCAPKFVGLLIERIGKYVPATLLVCVLVGFLLKPDPDSGIALPIEELMLIFISYLLGMSKLNYYYVFFGGVMFYFGIVNLSSML